MNLSRIHNNLYNETHIWVVDLDQWNLSCVEAMQQFPDAEAGKARRFRFKIHRDRYVKGRFMLRSLLGMYLGIDFYDQEFHVSRYGKPALQDSYGDNSIHFNISNSGNIYVCAFNQSSDTGIDIEKIQELPDMDQIVAASFSDEERRKFHSLSEPDRKRAFFQYWARKEAWLKAMGMGLSYPMNNVDTVTEDENSSLLMVKTEGADISNQWTILDLDICTGFASALALKGEHHDLAGQIRFFHPADECMISFKEINNHHILCGAEI
jgi:4'-phosphopantetheinyl transferase